MQNNRRVRDDNYYNATIAGDNNVFPPTLSQTAHASASSIHSHDLPGNRVGNSDLSRTYDDNIFAPYTQDRSVLIPYKDLCAARASLPTLVRTRTEDPVRFIFNTESILR